MRFLSPTSFLMLQFSTQHNLLRVRFNFDRPAEGLEALPVPMVHGQEIRCREPVFPILVNPMKHADEPVFLPVGGQTVIRNHKGRDGAVLPIIKDGSMKPSEMNSGHQTLLG